MTNIQLQEANVAFERMYEYANLTPQCVVSPPDPAFRFESLIVNNLNVRFPGRPLLLENISFMVRKGELVALMGESGSGKSTLLQVLQRFYVPEDGQIRVNKTDWQAITTSTWRQILGVVPQHINLFSGTLLDNICLGNAVEEAEQIVQFCRDYGFDHYFEVFPQSYLTLLGEDGVNLSGGQRQLVALARALYGKPQVLLLDEPTAAKDSHTEQFVVTLLERLLPQTAIVLITHKPAMTHMAARSYWLENGQLQFGKASCELATEWLPSIS